MYQHVVVSSYFEYITVSCRLQNIYNVYQYTYIYIHIYYVDIEVPIGPFWKLQGTASLDPSCPARPAFDCSTSGRPGDSDIALDFSKCSLTI